MSRDARVVLLLASLLVLAGLLRSCAIERGIEHRLTAARDSLLVARMDAQRSLVASVGLRTRADSLRAVADSLAAAVARQRERVRVVIEQIPAPVPLPTVCDPCVERSQRLAEALAASGAAIDSQAVEIVALRGSWAAERASGDTARTALALAEARLGATRHNLPVAPARSAGWGLVASGLVALDRVTVTAGVAHGPLWAGVSGSLGSGGLSWGPAVGVTLRLP